jgi:hypothetical protein
MLESPPSCAQGIRLLAAPTGFHESLSGSNESHESALKSAGFHESLSGSNESHESALKSAGFHESLSGSNESHESALKSSGKAPQMILWVSLEAIRPWSRGALRMRGSRWNRTIYSNEGTIQWTGL